MEINLAYLHSVTGGDKSFEKMLLENAVSDIELNISKLQEAWHTENAAEVHTATHTLKSVVAIAGLIDLENLCRRADGIFRDGTFHLEESETISGIIEGWSTMKPKLQNIVSGY